MVLVVGDWFALETDLCRQSILNLQHRENKEVTVPLCPRKQIDSKAFDDSPLKAKHRRPLAIVSSFEPVLIFWSRPLEDGRVSK